MTLRSIGEEVTAKAAEKAGGKVKGFAPKLITTDKLKSYSVAICKERLWV